MTNEERIKADAERYTKDEGYQRVYIAGATTENYRAQVLVDALEWIKTYGPVDELTVKFIDNSIRKWKGEKEVGDE